MQFRVLIEHDPKTRSYVATVPGLPIFVDANSENEAIEWAKEGLRLYFEETKKRQRSSRDGRAYKAKVITVEL